MSSIQVVVVVSLGRRFALRGLRRRRRRPPRRLLLADLIVLNQIKVHLSAQVSLMRRRRAPKAAKMILILFASIVLASFMFSFWPNSFDLLAGRQLESNDSNRVSSQWPGEL